MLDLLSFLAAVGICMFLPFEVNRIRNGWTAKKFLGDRGQFLVSYRNQISYVLRLAVMCAGIYLVLALFLASDSAERIEKFIVAALWLAAIGVCVLSRRAIPEHA